MDPKSITNAISLFVTAIVSGLKEVLVSIGIEPSKVSGVINAAGLFLAGIITVAVVTAGIISYIRGAQFEPFMNSYEDDAFVRGRAGTVMGVLTIVCAVWFLFAIVYIYFIQ